MKISTFLLSLSGLCVFYVNYADWIDEIFEVLTESYFGWDYEEVAPFIPSVDSGTDEFDSLVELHTREPEGTSSYYVTGLVLSLLSALTIVLAYGKVLIRLFTRRPHRIAVRWPKRYGFPGLAAEIIGEKRKRDDVQVIWKGNNLMESSMHCNMKAKTEDGKINEGEDPKPCDMGGAGGDEDVTPSSSNESTVQRLVEIRKLLESEAEIVRKCVDKGAGTEDFSGSAMSELQQRLESDASVCANTHFTPDKTVGTSVSLDEAATDTKLMNRIRLLESRLRLEELKNRNWISRMSRAEGILQQLNKQVERIERSRPMEGTLMETLKITSTVTNWMPVTQPRRNLQFTFVKRCPLQQPRFDSLSDYIKKEIALPYSQLDPRRIMSVPKSCLVPSIPASLVTPHTSIFSKFLSK